MLKNLFRKIRESLSGEVKTSALIEIGLMVGRNFHREHGCINDPAHCWLITIGDNVTLAPNVHILAHDASTKRALGYARVGCVTIGDNVFIGAGVIILPNVKVGGNCIIGAGSVVSRSIPDNSVAVGSPARVISSTPSYLQRNRELMQVRPIWDESFTLRKDITSEQKLAMREALADGIGFIE